MSGRPERGGCCGARHWGGFDATARVSAKGECIAVTYARKPATEGDSTASERKVVLFDRNGHRLFADKGGLYFAPQLIALSLTDTDYGAR